MPAPAVAPAQAPADTAVMDPGVKELLSTCARYNLEQVSDPEEREEAAGASAEAEVLEEIR